jgi:outer membrane protein OmpA-like peptidoglycan-associated protein
MRTFVNRSTTFWLLTAALALGSIAAPRVSAQSFDEFDDEFEDRQRATASPSTSSTSSASSSSSSSSDSALQAGDLEGDEFGTGDTSSSASTSSSTSSASPARPEDGHAYDARGDLLSSPGSRAWRRRRFPLHNTYFGSVGGIHIVDAGSGPSMSFRVGLLTNFFVQNGFLFPGDQDSRIGGSASVSWTPFDFLEIYGSIQSYANYNADPGTEPHLFQVLGDSMLGLKGYYEIIPAFTIGGDVSAQLLNRVGGIGLDNLNIGIRLNGTLDLRALQGVEFPFIARLNAQYYLDNSANLTNGVEQRRYAALPTSGPDARRPYADETRQLLTRVERFALGINRTDFLNIGIGIEMPLELPLNDLPGFYISPIVEWQLGVPINRNGYNCLFIPSAPGSGTPATGQDGCIAHQGFASFPSTLTLGVRVEPSGVFRGLGITAAVDIGTTGMNTFVRELAGNAPYQVLVGASWAYDTMEEPAEIREVSVERVVTHEVPPPPRGRIVGTIVEQGTTTPVRDAVVTFPGHDLTALAAVDGHFTSYELAPGEIAIAVTAPQYHDGSCAGTIPAEGGDVTVQCELEAMPRLGQVAGHLSSDSGGAVGGATVTVTGPQGFTVVTSPSGDFTRQDLPPGTYTARVEAENFLITTAQFTVVARETARADITVISRPSRSLVRLGAREITIRRQVNFATDSSDILPDSEQLLTEIADVLLRHPDIAHLEIQGHTDNRGGHDHNMDLSQRRAEAVRDWLVAHGVEASRLEAHGYGDTQPVAPNITAGGRARNRRVQFIITGRSE